MDALPNFALDGFLVGSFRFLLMLSVLVFVHELGHFVAAKLCGIYVATFSIGFGKRLLGFKRQETDYRLSALPFGGYVKMVGQSDMPEDPDAEPDPDAAGCPDHMRFDAKPIWQRVVVSAAGPVMSLAFGIVIYWVMFVAGVPLPRGMMDTRVGYVEPDGPAAKAGIQAGDRIVAINGQQPRDWEDLRLAIIGVGLNTVPVEVQGEQGDIRRVELTPRLREGESLASVGINYYEEFLVEEVFADRPAGQAGMRPGDVIVGIRDPAGKAFPASALQQVVRANIGEPISFELVRDGTALTLPVAPERLVSIGGLETDGAVVLDAAGPQWADVPRAQVPRLGDHVVAVNGVSIAEGQSLPLEAALSDPGEARVPVEFARKSRRWTVMLPTVERGIIGIRYTTDTDLYQYGPMAAVPKAVEKFNTTVRQTFATIGYFFTGSVSTRELAGPLGIAHVSEQVAKFGLVPYLQMVALITINLGILNILPIPVLDGGNIMILLVEGVRRRPLSDRAMYYVQHAGLVFILFLMAFATFNDIRRGIEALFG